MRAGSLSDVSTVTHTASRWSASTHCASAVVLPYPAGATSTTSGCADVKDSRSSSLERRTSPGRWIGADSLGPAAATVTKGRAPHTSEELWRASPVPSGQGLPLGGASGTLPVVRAVRRLPVNSPGVRQARFRGIVVGHPRGRGRAPLLARSVSFGPHNASETQVRRPRV